MASTNTTQKRKRVEDEVTKIEAARGSLISIKETLRGELAQLPQGDNILRRVEEPFRELDVILEAAQGPVR